jgi:hypothetical protein
LEIPPNLIPLIRAMLDHRERLAADRARRRGSDPETGSDSSTRKLLATAISLTRGRARHD